MYFASLLSSQSPVACRYAYYARGTKQPLLPDLIPEAANGNDFVPGQGNLFLEKPIGFSGRTLALHDVYDSLSVNDYMTAYSFYTKTIEDGTCVMIDIRLWGYGLEDISITEASQIQTVEFSFSVNDQNYKEIDEVTVAITIE